MYGAVRRRTVRPRACVTYGAVSSVNGALGLRLETAGTASLTFGIAAVDDEYIDDENKKVLERCKIRSEKNWTCGH